MCKLVIATLVFSVATQLALVQPAAAQPAATAPAAVDTDELEALLNQPVYAASKFSQAAADAPASVTVLTTGDIRAFGWRTLAEVLNGARGVHVRNDRSYSYVGVRGFNRPGDYTSRLLVLIDGQRVNENVFDGAPAGREFVLDVGLIERVEFLPGPGSALYGSNAVLGVVNVITRSPASLGVGGVTVEFGSATSRLLRVSTAREFADGAWMVSAVSERRPGRDLYYAEYDTPATNDGVARGIDDEATDKLYAKLQSGRLTVTGMLSDRRKTIPTGAYGLQFNDGSAVFRDRYGLLGAAWQTDPRAEHSFYVHTGLAAYRYGDKGRNEPGFELVGTSASGNWWTLEARWTGRMSADHVLVAGVELQRNTRQDQGSVTLEPNPVTDVDLRHRSQRAGIFFNDEWSLGAGVRLNLGVRADRHSDGRSGLTPRLGAVWTPTEGLVLKLLAGSAYREPNAYELQYADSFSAANPTLQRERLASRELALDWRLASHWRLAGSVYRYEVNGLIEQELDANSGLLMYRNKGRAVAHGTELEADYVAPSGWRLRSSWTTQRTRDANDQPLSDSPQSTLKLHAVFPLPMPQSLSATRLGVEVQRLGERRTLAGDRLPAVAVGNLSLQYTPNGPWSLSATVYNVGDRHFSDPAGREHIQDVLPQDGRAWRLQWALQF
jgi:iron complex outermembrane receptor protein